MKIALLTGGYDQEKEISLKSVQTWQKLLRLAGENFKLFILPDDEQKILTYIKNFDLLIPIIHGKGGEDGYIISKIKEKSITIPYIFSTPEVMKVTFDKAKTNEIVKELDLNIQVPEFEKVNVSSKPDKILEKLSPYSKFIFKPNQGGSSFNTFIFEYKNIKKLKNSIFKILKQTNKDFLIQQFVPIYREFSASIFGDWDKNPLLLGISHIQYEKSFFDYEAKYEGASTETHYLIQEFSNKFGKQLTTKLQKDLLNIYKHLKIRTLARIDFLQDYQGNFRFLEVNTIPGFTSASIYPSIAKKYFGNLVNFWISIKKNLIKY